MDTRTVFELRREGKIQEALDMALKLYQIDPYDNRTQNALAWPLIDLCKSSLAQNSLNQAQKYFNQLIAINFTDIDDIITSQIAFLRPKIDRNYAKIQEAENLSKNGNHKLALSNMKAMFANNELLDVHHEAFGWVIYRYIKAEENNIPSVAIRSLMRDYLNLKNEKTSLLHSIFLNFALHFSKAHSDFNLYNFFLLWDPKNLRREDLYESHNDGKTYPSLISRIFRELIEKKSQLDINVLIEKIPSLSPSKILDLLRDPFYWKVYNADKENRKEDVWKLYDEYNTLFKGQIGSETHSKVLNSAMFSMNDNDEWRFLNFFENWNPTNFIESDWKEVKKDDKVYKPIAIKALKKTFELIKAGGNFNNLELLITAFKIAISKFPKDIWLKREYAILSAKNHNSEEAIQIYKTLILELGDQAYMWHEFSKFLEDRDLNLSVGMLSKAIRLQNDESFLGDIRLDLADNLIKLNNLEEAVIELNIYAKHRELKGWKLSEKYNLLHSLVKEINTEKLDNSKLYFEKIKLAEDFAYQDIKWTELVLTEKWKNDKNKEKLNFTDGDSINISVSANRFNILKNIGMGDLIKFKLHSKLVEDKTKNNYLKYDNIALIAKKSEKEKWSILEDVIAIVDYINVERKIIHSISSDNKEMFFPEGNLKLAIGDFIRGKKIQKKIKDEIRFELRDISKCQKNSVIEKFTKYLAVVDSVNIEKQFFHYVVNNRIEGIVRLKETQIVPSEGDFVQLRLVHKLDKKRNKIQYKYIEIVKTEETSSALRKEISGMLKLKYRRNGSILEMEDIAVEKINNSTPDFGFIEDYYVPKEVIFKSKIDKNCDVDAKVVFTGDKWKVYDLKPILKMQNDGLSILNWELLQEHNFFFNQFFSTFYPFTNNQIISLKNKLSIGAPFGTSSNYNVMCYVPSKTIFGLIFNKNIKWSNDLKKHFENYSVIFDEGIFSDFEYFPRLPLDIVTEFKKDMDNEIDNNIAASLSLFDESGNFIEDDYHNNLELQIENDKKRINDDHYSYLNKEIFTDDEFLKIITNASVGYFVNRCFTDLLFKRIYNQIPDFSIDRFYE